MSRTHRKHRPKRLHGQPRVRSAVAQAAYAQTGAGAHGKTHKQKRGNERVQLRKDADA